MSAEQLRRARAEFRRVNDEYNRLARARDGMNEALAILDYRVNQLIREIREAMDECQRIRQEMK